MLVSGAARAAAGRGMVYDADITAKGYAPVAIRNLPIFEGILSVQRTAMIPRSEDSGETISENEPDLTEVPNA